jgi:hypothetical protein
VQIADQVATRALHRAAHRSLHAQNTTGTGLFSYSAPVIQSITPSTVPTSGGVTITLTVGVPLAAPRAACPDDDDDDDGGGGGGGREHRLACGPT